MGIFLMNKDTITILRYDISSLRVVILKLLQNLRVKTSNMTDILNAMSKS